MLKLESKKQFWNAYLEIIFSYILCQQVHKQQLEEEKLDN
jgi:hypothetical protein